jgi:ubiquinone/menaquinone biosynthesis C-methylase UbiE
VSDQPELEFTGERFTPECVREIAYEHWHRYAWAAQLVRGKRILDAACGEGYGSYLLSREAAHVTAIDIDQQSIEHATRRYPGQNIDFRQADCTALPLADDSVDVVVSFETLEHLAEQDQLLTEFRRVLRSDGFLLISSPDKKTYSDETGYENPFHVRELYRDELEALLQQHFPAFRLFGQKLMFVSALWSLQGQGESESLMIDEDGLEAASCPQFAPLYFLAVAAADPRHLPSTRALSLFSDRAESVYQHYNDEVRKHIRAGQLLAERDAEIDRLRTLLEQSGP